jgi:PAS domain S-box-containing protein
MWRLSGEIMLVSDIAATIVAVNPAFSALLGWEAGEVVGTSFGNLVHPDDRESTLRATSSRFENRYRRKDGGHATLSWSAVAEAGLIYAVARDVSAERAAAAAMKLADQALRQSQKMDAIGKLTGGIAHDFNNLLHVISGNLQMLATVPMAHPRAGTWVDNAIVGVERGARLASSLLAFGRRQALEPKVVKVGRVVAEMEESLRRTLGEPIHMETVVAGGLWHTLVDIAQVETAVLNLAINARDAMAGGGRLTLEVANAHLDHAYCARHMEVAPGEYVMLAVSDTGCGMPSEVAARAFDPFFSTKPESMGTGLGLSMVHGFVKQSGGHVKIYSEPGHGTSVKLYLPRSINAEAAPEPVAPAATVGGGETILVAEDDEGVRAIVVEMLSDLGYRVLTANDADGALSILNSGARVDLLFTDVVMPGALRSPELARLAVELLPGLAVLFTSGYTENAIVHGGRLDPGVELLGKPYTRDALAKKIRLVLERNQRDRPAPAVAAAAPTRILLVEDEQAVRMITVDMLELLDHSVVAVGDGRSALSALENGRFDILLTDLGLPGMSGQELARQARLLYPSMRIILASGQAQASGTAADAVLLKPYSMASLEAVVLDVA